MLGNAMLSGRGLLTSTGEAGALDVIALEEQTSNQNTIRGLFSNNTVHVNQWQTNANKPPSELLKLLSKTDMSLHKRNSIHHMQQNLKNIYLSRLLLAFPKHAKEAFVFFLLLILIFARCDCSCNQDKQDYRNLTALLELTRQFKSRNTCMTW